MRFLTAMLAPAVIYLALSTTATFGQNNTATSTSSRPFRADLAKLPASQVVTMSLAEFIDKEYDLGFGDGSKELSDGYATDVECEYYYAILKKHDDSVAKHISAETLRNVRRLRIAWRTAEEEWLGEESEGGGTLWGHLERERPAFREDIIRQVLIQMDHEPTHNPSASQRAAISRELHACVPPVWIKNRRLIRLRDELTRAVLAFPAPQAKIIADSVRDGMSGFVGASGPPINNGPTFAKSTSPSTNLISKFDKNQVYQAT